MSARSAPFQLTLQLRPPQFQLTVQLRPHRQVIQLSDALSPTFCLLLFAEHATSWASLEVPSQVRRLQDSFSRCQMVLLNQLGLDLPRWQILHL
jgi:hypothetical protein